jgi:hypothetical protein
MRKHIPIFVPFAAVAVVGLLAASLSAQYPFPQSYRPPYQPPYRPPEQLYQPPRPLEAAAPPEGYQTVYRLVNLVNNDHVYTIDLHEVHRLSRSGSHRYEGPAFLTLTERYDGTLPLYRFVLPDAAKHMLGIQRWAGADQGARFEAVLGYIDASPRPGLHPLTVWYNPTQNLFFYTSKGRGEFAPLTGYTRQGILGYVARP